MKRLFWIGLCVVAAAMAYPDAGLANKSETTIQGPLEAMKGSEVIVRITVTHSANTASHYTEWVKVTANKREVGRWDYTKDQRPEGAVFTKEKRITGTEDTEIVAEASCNLHGGKGPTKHVIKAK